LRLFCAGDAPEFAYYSPDRSPFTGACPPFAECRLGSIRAARILSTPGQMGALHE
jgi:hypothetical protein